MRHLIRQIIIEHACACEEMGMELPVPGVAYPIEIEEIIVDPITDLVTAGAEEPAIEIDIAHDALDPTLDTIENIMLGEPEKPKSQKGTKMARAKLFRMGKLSQSFHDRIEDDQYLPQWLHDKLAIAEDKLQDAYNYIDYKLHRQEMEGKMCNEATIRRWARNYLRS